MYCPLPVRLPVMQGGQHGHLAHHGPEDVTDPDALLQGGLAGEAREPGVARQRLGGAVVGGTVLLGVASPLAEAVLLDVDDARVDLPDVLVADVPAVGDGGPEIELDHVGLGAQLLEDLLGHVDVQVEGHVVLVGVDVDEHGPLFLVEPAEGVERTGHVAHGRQLDLDDLGAQFGKKGRAGRPEQERADFENPEPAQGARPLVLGLGVVFENSHKVPSFEDRIDGLQGPDDSRRQPHR